MDLVTSILLLLVAVVASGALSRASPLPLPLPLAQIALGMAIGWFTDATVALRPDVFFLLFLPPLLFLDERGRVVARLNGYYPPHRFMAALQYVAEKQEGRITFREYLARQAPPPANGRLHAEPFFTKPPYDLTKPVGGKPLALLPSGADAVAGGPPPAALDPDEAAVVDFCRELHETKQVSDAAWGAALERFGERGVIDLIGTCGYYAAVSMVLNAARVPMPGGVAPPLAPLS